LNQVQEESLEDPEDGPLASRQAIDASATEDELNKTTLSKKLDFTPMKREAPFNNS
jgi:hypothetical protein